MVRGTARSFGSDRQATSAAKTALQNGWDLRIDEPARQSFYMPLMHSESLMDQDRAVRLINMCWPEGKTQQLHHAQAHREIIRELGRFPARNDALAVGQPFRRSPMIRLAVMSLCWKPLPPLHKLASKLQFLSVTDF